MTPASAESAVWLEPGPARRWSPPVTPVDPGLVLRLCRYRDPGVAPLPIREVAAAMAARAGDLAEPQALYRAARVSEAGASSVRLAGGPAFTGRSVAGLLGPCPIAVLFALTLGPRIESEARARAERQEPLEAYLLEMAAWAAIESAVRSFRHALKAGAQGSRLRVTHRLAPGYGDWPLGEQAALVGMLGETGGLVEVTPESVLRPQKSITGVFGLFPAGPEVRYGGAAPRR